MDEEVERRFGRDAAASADLSRVPQPALLNNVFELETQMRIVRECNGQTGFRKAALHFFSQPLEPA